MSKFKQVAQHSVGINSLLLQLGRHWVLCTSDSIYIQAAYIRRINVRVIV